MSVKEFILSNDILIALTASLSPERFATYQNAIGGDRERAMRLYTWNTGVSAAFYGPLQGLEVALRNAMHRELAKRYGADWYDNPACALDSHTLNRIDKAKNSLKRGGYPVDPPHLVAELSFGFWVSMLGPGGRGSPPGTRKSNYEMTLWRPALHKAFPHVRIGRAAAHRPLDFLRTFRNRIAHHEPIFDRHLKADYDSILAIAGWICPNTREWIAHHSRVTELLAMPKDSNDMSF